MTDTLPIPRKLVEQTIRLLCSGSSWQERYAMQNALRSALTQQAEGAKRTDRLGHLPEPAYRERYPGPDNTELVCEYFTDHQMREYARQEVYAAEERWSVPATPPSPSASAEPAYTKEWCMRMAKLEQEGDADFEAGERDAQPSGEVLTEAEIRSAVLSVGPEASGRVSMTYDSGSYEVTKITYIGERICRAVERATLAKIGARHG